MNKAGAKSLRLHSAVNDSYREPCAARDFCQRAEVQPDEEANSESGERGGEVRPTLSLARGRNSA